MRTSLSKTSSSRFYFFSLENNEPPHVHVESAENGAKFWLSPVTLVWAVGYNSRQLRQLRKLVEENAAFFVRPGTPPALSAPVRRPPCPPRYAVGPVRPGLKPRG